MSRDKTIIHELPVEELIKLATKSDEEIVTDKLTEAAKFIYALKIKHGKEPISAPLIYHTYKLWKGWDNKKQAKPFFFRDFSTFFEKYRTKDGTSYLLDPKPFDLSKETYWLMRADMRREKSRRKKNEKQKNKAQQSKTSSLNKKV